MITGYNNAVKPAKENEPKLDPKIRPCLFDSISRRTFDVYEFIGKGGFAWCYKAADQNTRHLYALKVIPKSRLTSVHTVNKVKREITLHSPLSHPNVVTMISAFDCPDNVYMVLEYCSQQSMVQYLRTMPNNRMNENQTMIFMQQLICGTEFLHWQAKILHRDLKLANLLITKTSVLKIADFGLASTISDIELGSMDETVEQNGKRNMCGTPNYFSPEVITRQEYSIASEAWSIGCIMYAMLFGRPPFETNDVNLTYRVICEGKYNLFNNLCKETPQVDCNLVVVSYEARHFIGRLLDHDPPKRPLPVTRLFTYEVFFRPLHENTIKNYQSNITGGCQAPNQINAIYSNWSLSGDSGIDVGQPAVTIRPALLPNHPRPQQPPPQPNDVLQVQPITGHTIAIPPYLHCLLKPAFDRLSHFLLHEIDIPLTRYKSKQLFDQCLARDNHTTYVTKWVDYSNQLGLGYVLNDGRGCALYNDGALMTLDVATRRCARYRPNINVELEYDIDVTQQVADQLTYERLEQTDQFVQYMEYNLLAPTSPFLVPGNTNCGTRAGGIQRRLSQCSYCRSFTKDCQADIVFWQRCVNHILFVFSDSTFQVNFLDTHAKIVVGPSRDFEPINNDMLLTYFNASNQTFVVGESLNLLNSSLLSQEQIKCMMQHLQLAQTLLHDIAQL